MIFHHGGEAPRAGHLEAMILLGPRENPASFSQLRIEFIRRSLGKRIRMRLTARSSRLARAARRRPGRPHRAYDARAPFESSCSKGCARTIPRSGRRLPRPPSRPLNLAGASGMRSAPRSCSFPEASPLRPLSVDPLCGGEMMRLPKVGADPEPRLRVWPPAPRRRRMCADIDNGPCEQRASDRSRRSSTEHAGGRARSVHVWQALAGWPFCRILLVMLIAQTTPTPGAKQGATPDDVHRRASSTASSRTSWRASWPARWRESAPCRAR